MTISPQFLLDAGILETFFREYAITSILVIDVIAVIVWIWDRQQQKRRKLETKRKAEMETKIAELKLNALLSQMNPHFISNAMATIQHYISINDQKSAYNYLSKFADLIRKILENSKKTVVTLENEMQCLETYIQLEAMRFKDQFEYEIDIDPDLDTNHTYIPTMLIQPFVENAIKHGLLNQKKKGRLTIILEKREGNDVFCSIEDNGIGRERAAEIKSKRKVQQQSFGMKDTQERIEILNAQSQGQTSFTIIDKKDGKGKPAGTRVEMTVPVQVAYDGDPQVMFVAPENTLPAAAKLL